MDWTVLKDVAIPVASILIPSCIAIWLAKSERKAAMNERASERVSRGIEEAFAAMSDLVEAAYTDDFRKAAMVRIRAAGRLERIEHGLGREHEAVWDWVAEEFKVVARGLEDIDHRGLPVLMEKIVWRGANFSTIISNWRSGKLDSKWFGTADHPALESTMSPEEADAINRS